MKSFDAQQTEDALGWQALIEALRQGFIEGCQAPQRHAHEFDIPDEENGTLLLMPAWGYRDYLGVKQVLVIPENAKRNFSSVCASYQLYSARNGQALASLDGGVLTNRRTAAASALAADYLAKHDAKSLLIVGTGGLAAALAEAHSQLRSIEKILIWGRDPSKAKHLATMLEQRGYPASATNDLAKACSESDIISCATSSNDPLIKGAWLSAGSHVDLVGVFSPTMRECDTQTVINAQVFVDTFEGALSEAGDLLIPISENSFDKNMIEADLHQLCTQSFPGRQNDQDITLFKSVGTALEDIVAAVLAYEKSIKALG